MRYYAILFVIIVVPIILFFLVRTLDGSKVIKGLLWMVVGIGAIAVMCALVWGGKRLRLVFFGTKAVGEVVEPAFVPTRASRPNRGGTYHMVVEYRASGGTVHRYTSSTGSAGKLEAQPADQTIVYFDPADPDNAMISNFADGALGPFGIGMFGMVFVWMGIIGLHAMRNYDPTKAVQTYPADAFMANAGGGLFLTIGLIALLGAVLWGGSQFRLALLGARSTGTVVTARRDRNDYQMTGISFETADGTSHHFAQMTAPSISTFKIGDRVSVRYDPALPGDALLLDIKQLIYRPAIVAIFGLGFSFLGGAVIWFFGSGGK